MPTHKNNRIYKDGNNYYLYKNGEKIPVTYKNYRYSLEDGTFLNTMPTRVKDNTSKTAHGTYDIGGNTSIRNSTNAEDITNILLFGKNSKGEYYYGDPNIKYAVPFLEDKLILVQNNRTSTNVLDSIAKYAGQAQIPIEDALGLYHESVYGSAPLFNTSSALANTKNAPKLSDKQKKNRDRVLLNANYHRAYGLIPAQNMMRDFEYNDGGYNVNKPFDRNMPPLLHAFDYYDRGLYNPGDTNHTKNTRMIGNKIMKEADVIKWWNNTGRRYYNIHTTFANRRYLRQLESIYGKVKRRKHTLK